MRMRALHWIGMRTNRRRRNFAGARASRSDKYMLRPQAVELPLMWPGRIQYGVNDYSVLKCSLFTQERPFGRQPVYSERQDSAPWASFHHDHLSGQPQQTSLRKHDCRPERRVATSRIVRTILDTPAGAIVNSMACAATVANGMALKQAALTCRAMAGQRSSAHMSKVLLRM